MPSALPHPLAPYLPQLAFLGSASGAPPERAPHRESIFCTVLFADLSGFTARTSAIASLPNGPETIGALLNAHLGPLVQICESYGGDVVKFAGDALLVCWPDPDHGADVRASVLSATACAMAMQTEIADMSSVDPSAALQLKVGLATGPVRVLHLGSASERRVLLVSGDGVDRATRGAAEAAPGEIRIGRLAHQLVGDEVQARWDGETSVVEELAPLEYFRPPDCPQRQWHPRMRAYLPLTIRNNNEPGRRAWLTETRVITAMFVHLPNMGMGADPAHLNDIFLTASRAIHSGGGITNKVSIDEKGVTLLVVFGLPPRVHEDDAARACRAALAVLRALRQAGEAVSIGIATGRAFCGEIGGEERREYTVIGDAVNTAARLMGAGPGHVTCDRETAERAAGTTSFRPLSPVRLKGKPHPVERFQPTGRLRRKPAAAKSSRPLGRDVVFERLIRASREVAGTGQVATELIVGPAGIGKSAIAHEAAQMLAAEGCRVVSTQADGHASAHQGSPLRPVLETLFGTGPSPAEVARIRTVLKEAVGEEAPLLGLVADLLPVSVATQHDPTGGGDPHIRANLLARIIEAGLGQVPTVVILEDVHWLDPLTLATIHVLQGAQIPLMWLLTARPPPDASPAVWSDVLQLAAPVQLAPLPRPHTRQLLARRLGSRRVPTALTDLVFARSAGNPLFIGHLADHLRATGAVVVQDGRVRVRTEQVLRWQAGLPVTLESLLLSRVDRLDARAQITLKVASIFGERFDTAGVASAHPIHTTEDALLSDLHELERQEVIASTPGRGAWRFRHILIRDAIYEILPFAQRQELHRAAAAYLGQRRPAPWFDIALHHRSAGDDAEALEAFTRSAVQAALHGMVAECSSTLEATAVLLRRIGPTPVQAARIAMAQATVLDDLGQPEEARRRLAVAVGHLSAGDGSTDAHRPERALAHLLGGRIDLRSDRWAEAADHARRAREARPDSEAVQGSGVILEAMATWRQAGPAAARAMLGRTQAARGWESEALSTLLQAVSAPDDDTIGAHLEALHTALGQPELRRLSLDDRAMLIDTTAGLLFLAGEVELASRLVEAPTFGRSAHSTIRLRAIFRLLLGTGPLDTEAPVHPPAGSTERVTMGVAEALRSWQSGARDRARVALLQALESFEHPGVPTPDLWPALLAAVLLAEALASDMPSRVLDHLDSLIGAAGRGTPSSTAACGVLRLRLARARGQTVRSWWLQARAPRTGTTYWAAVYLELPPACAPTPEAAVITPDFPVLGNSQAG